MFEEIPLALLLVGYFLGFGLILIELLIPGLIAGSIGSVLVLVSLVGITIKSTGTGVVLILFTVVAGVFVIRLALRRVTLRQSLDTASGYSSAREGLVKLNGHEGVSVTPLRPSGTAEFDGDRVDVVTLGELIAKDTRVKVIEVEGNRVVVKALELTE